MTWWSVKRQQIVRAIVPIIPPEWWSRRYEIEWYVSRCDKFCDTDNMRRMCAMRYMAGKRKVTPPGTSRRKKAEIERRKLLANMPIELVTVLDDATRTEAANQYINGNAKALNALVGMVLKAHKTDAELVRNELLRRLNVRQETMQQA